VFLHNQLLAVGFTPDTYLYCYPEAKIVIRL
jgi:hypothetical protein